MDFSADGTNGAPAMRAPSRAHIFAAWVARAAPRCSWRSHLRRHGSRVVHHGSRRWRHGLHPRRHGSRVLRHGSRVLRHGRNGKCWRTRPWTRRAPPSWCSAGDWRCPADQAMLSRCQAGEWRPATERNPAFAPMSSRRNRFRAHVWTENLDTDGVSAKKPQAGLAEIESVRMFLAKTSTQTGFRPQTSTEMEFHHRNVDIDEVSAKKPQAGFAEIDSVRMFGLQTSTQTGFRLQTLAQTGFRRRNPR